MAVFGDRSLYVECERGTKKNYPQRSRKWNNYFQVSTDFYIVVPNTRAQGVIVGEFDRWTYDTGRSVHLYLCNLTAVTEDRLWTLERKF